MAWAKLHTDILSDPKLMRAARKGARGLVYLPWFIAFAKQADDGGRLSIADEPADPADIAYNVPDATPEAIDEAMDSLEAIGVLERDDDGCLRFVAWDRRSGTNWNHKGERLTDDSDGLSYVYYARCGERVKIGYSANPWSRINEMRTSWPGIELVGTERGDRALERQRQQELGGRTDFKNSGRGSEWFAWTPEIEAFVGTLQDNGVAPTKRRSAKRSSPTTENRSRGQKRGEEKRTEKEKELAADAARPSVVRAARPPRAESWVTEGVALWESIVGSVPHGEFGSQLKPMVERHGWPAVHPDLAKWLRERVAAGKQCKPAWYAGEVTARLAKKPPIVNEHGELTEYGERITRPDKVPA